MNNKFVTLAAYSALTVFATSGAALSSEVATQVSISSIDGAGRNIMRTADGGIVAAFSAGDVDQSSLVFSRSLNNGASWDNVALGGVKGAVRQVAIDSNFQGSYIAFTEDRDNGIVGRIGYSSAPFGTDPQITISQTVTPEGVVPQDTFIQASRAGWGNLAADNRETVAYGWQDAVSKGLYVGVSPDGRTFPMAQLVVEDEFAMSGPAVAVRGNYVIATYQTRNPELAPRDVPIETISERAFPAWIESTDGGQTWSEPKPLFGLTTLAFPTVSVQTPQKGSVQHRLAGGSILPNSPTLNWSYSVPLGLNLRRDKSLPSVQEPRRELRPQDGQQLEQLPKIKQPPKIKQQPSKQLDEGSLIEGGQRNQLQKSGVDSSLGGITFVQTSMASVDGYKNGAEISIVSFRPIEPNAKWTHVIANSPLTSDRAQFVDNSSIAHGHGSQFQYSALVDTAVRATTYKEHDTSTGQTRLVAAVSTDTGKTFDHHTSFNTEELAAFGVRNFGDAGTVFAVSQCLFEDRDGKVYVDVIFTNGNKLKFASLPLGVNAADLREQEHANLVSR